MRTARPLITIGKSIAATIFLFSALAVPLHAFADEVKFTASLDHDEISLDDSVTLKMSIQTDTGSVGDVSYNAPSFETVNQYNAVQSESYYDESSGRIGMRTSYEVNKILKPTKTGTFSISGIHVQVGGKNYTAPDLSVTVSGSGQATPPPRNYGGAGVGLRGSGKHSSLPSVFARAEVDKSKAYKGEQVIVSYYLYQRARAFNIEVTKYPVLNGFLREELEMPYLQQKLNMEQVVLDGVGYTRALLLRYAAYPLQEGKLDIDSIEMKYNYYSAQNGADPNDPMAAFQGFFQQALPGNSRSETLKIDVIPLPDSGKPKSFTGGVGDLDIASAIDKTEVHANEPVTITVKIEGHGNVESIGEPKANWPSNVELYDTKGVSKAGKGGVGQKTFEFLLIPREKGLLELPGLEFSYFDPRKNEYVTKKTEPFKVNVLEAAAGSNYVPKTTAANAPATQIPPIGKMEEARGLKTPTQDTGETSGLSGLPMWRWLYWICLAALGFFVLLIAKDGLGRARKNSVERSAAKAKRDAKSWQRMRAQAAQVKQPFPNVVQLYETIAANIFDSIERIYPVGSRSYSREELRRMLVEERQMPSDIWDRASRILEFAELVRFASSAGAVSEGRARAEAAQWVKEAEEVVGLIEDRTQV
jgi:hypothetical protein